MSSIDQLPPERDIPVDRHARMRARVLTTVAEPAARPRAVARLARRLPVRIAVAGIATMACVAVAWVGIGGRLGSDGQPEVYALGDGVLSSSTRDAGRKCLKSARTDGGTGKFVTWPANSPPVLLNHHEQPGRGASLIYRVQSRLFYCEIGPGVQDGPEPRDFVPGDMGVVAMGVLESTSWLPGPISMESARSTDQGGGYVQTAGRVSKDVAEVVLTDGTGHQSTARLAEGTFVVFSVGRIKPGAGMLISYDASGRVIDQRPALDQPTGRCYVDPAGNLVNPVLSHVFESTYKSGRVRCEPASPW